MVFYFPKEKVSYITKFNVNTLCEDWKESERMNPDLMMDSKYRCGFASRPELQG